MKPTLLILAAGLGSRYGSLKQIDAFGPSDESIMEYSIYDALKAGFGKIVFVIKKNIRNEFLEYTLKRFAEKLPIEYVYQELDSLPEGLSCPAERIKPWGAAHAVWVAKDIIKEPFAIINADDFYGNDTFRVTANFLISLQNNDTSYCLAGYKIKDTLSDYGTVSRGICEEKDNFLTSVVERTDVQKQNREIVSQDKDGKFYPLNKNAYCSMNVWGFTPTIFSFIEQGFIEFFKQNQDQPKAEYVLPLIANSLIEQNKASFKILDTESEWFGVTYKADKESAQNKINQLIKKGAYPSNLWK